MNTCTKLLFTITEIVALVILFEVDSLAQKNSTFTAKQMVHLTVNAPHQHDTSYYTGTIVKQAYSINNRYNLLTGLETVQQPSVRANTSNRNRNMLTNDGLSINVTTSSASCGHANGSMIVSATGGTAPYTYSYVYFGSVTVQNTGNFPYVYPGKYQVIVTDASGLSASTNIEVGSRNAPPVCTISASPPPSTCSSFDGAITLSASGGTPPYSYSLDNFNYQSNGLFENLSPGFYSGYVRDANGCISVSTGIFFGSSASCWALSLDYGGMACNKDGNLNAKVLGGGVAPYQYSLDAVHYQSAGSFYNLDPGVTHVFYKDATGMVNVYSVIIQHNCPPQYSYTALPASCNHDDGSISISASFGTAPYQFSLDGINYQSNPLFTGLRPGNYFFTVKDANEISFSEPVIVDNSCPTLTAFSTDDTCGHKNGTITATPANAKTPIQYSIDGIHFQSSNVFSGLQAGSYIVTLKDDDGNTATSTAIVGSSCINLEVSLTNAACNDATGSISVNANAGAAPFQFSLDGTHFRQTNRFDSLKAGTYTVYVKDANNELIDTTVTIAGSPLPVETIHLNDAGCDYTGGSLQINATGGKSPFLYSIDSTTYQSSPVFNNLDTGHYVAYVKDANGCISRQEGNLSSPPVPLVSIGNDSTFCKGDMMELSAPQNAGFTYEWQDKSTNYNYTVIKEGIYSVKVTNQFGCSASDTIEVSDKTIPAFTLGKDTSICEGPFSLDLTPQPFVEGYYSWNTGASSVHLAVNAPGYYRLEVSNYGCTASANITITTKIAPTVFLGFDTTLCEGTIYTLDASFGTSVYKWQDGATGSVYNVNQPGEYNVTVNLKGCIAKDTILISYLDKPHFTLGNDTTICPGAQIILNPGVNVPASYVWQDGSTQPYFKITEPGNYSLQASNVCGIESDDLYVGAGNCKLLLPDAFSPNGDGLNDVFKVIFPLQYSQFRFQVFNRFGEKVFETNDITRGWDGSYKGQLQPTGVYTWQIFITENGKAPYFRKGIVTLLR